MANEKEEEEKKNVETKGEKEEYESRGEVRRFHGQVRLALE